MPIRKAVYKVNSQPEGSRGFEDLEAYKLALDVMVNAHEVTKQLPAEENYDLKSQLRRASKSIAANIAEGYGRYHYLDSLRFYSNARGSLNETLNHFITAQLLGYIKQESFDELYALTRHAERALNGYMNWVRKQKQGDAEYGDKQMKEETSKYFVDEEDRETSR